MKNKINKRDLIPLKSTGIAEETINITKDNPPNGTIFANKNTYEEFLSKTNSLCTSISKKQPSQIEAQELSGPFSTEDREMGLKHMKRCSASMSIRELRI